MPRPTGPVGRLHMRIVLGGLSLLTLGLVVGATPQTATALVIYESAPNGSLATTLVDPSPFGDPAPVIVADQSLGVKFRVSGSVTTGSIGGYFAPYSSGTPSDILGAVVRLHGSKDFPNSFDLTTRDVLETTLIQVSDAPGNYAGDLSVRLTGGWYALVFSATGSGDEYNALMPRMSTDIGDPSYFFGRTTSQIVATTKGASSRGCSDQFGPRGLRSARKGPQSACEPHWWNRGFEYLDGGGLGDVRMFVDTAPANPVPEPSRLLLLGPGFAGVVGMAWRRHRRR